MVATAPRREYQHLNYVARGGAKELFAARDREILIEGAAGTGKTRAILELLHLLCLKYPGLRVLIVRKVKKDLGKSALRTYERFVIHRADKVRRYGQYQEPDGYTYPNGSEIIVGGLNNPGDLLSTEYDVIYVNEALGTDKIPAINIEDYETLLPRLRPAEEGFTPRNAKGELFNHRRIILDGNPSHDKHWLYQREVAINPRSGVPSLRVIKSYPQDNPAYFDEDGDPTPAGAAYIATLDDLTGTRFERFRLGLRVGVQNAIYVTFDRQRHVRDLPEGIEWKTGAIGEDAGEYHDAAAVAVRVDQFNRRWVVEAWGEPDPEKGEMTAREAGRLGLKYNIHRYRTDPTAADVALATTRLLGVDALVHSSSKSPGSRLARSRMVSRLLNDFAGGRVTKSLQEQTHNLPIGPYPEPDSPGLLFLRGGPGIEKLCDQMEAYHFKPIDTPTHFGRVLDRRDDDLVSALEYAIDELEADDFIPPVVGVQVIREADVNNTGKSAEGRFFYGFTNPDQRVAAHGAGSRSGGEERAPGRRA